MKTNSVCSVAWFQATATLMRALRLGQIIRKSSREKRATKYGWFACFHCLPRSLPTHHSSALEQSTVSRSVDRIEFSMMRMHLVVSLMPRRSSSPDLWCFRFSFLRRAAPRAASACRTNHANFEKKKTFLALSVFGRWFGFSIFFYLIFVCWIRWMGMERVMRRSAMDFPFYLILCNQMLLADCPVSDTMAKRGNFSERPKTLNIGN